MSAPKCARCRLHIGRVSQAWSAWPCETCGLRARLGNRSRGQRRDIQRTVGEENIRKRTYVRTDAVPRCKCWPGRLAICMARIYDSIIDTFGNTPLVKITRLSKSAATILVKLESFNPAGSVGRMHP